MPRIDSYRKQAKQLVRWHRERNYSVGEKVRLIPHSETSFSGTDGLSFDFDPDGNPAAFMVERHVSGDWKYKRQPQR